MRDRGEIDDVRVYLLRIWADAFQAFAIKGHSDFNSIQLYTVTILAPSGKQTKFHTLPYALGFKKEDVSEIFDNLLTECHELLSPREMYCGSDNKVISAMFLTEQLSFDLPERFKNAQLCSYSGTLMKKFGWSCDVSRPDAWICLVCENAKAKNHLPGNYNVLVEDCGKCTMCMDPSRTRANRQVLPCEVEDAVGSHHYVKLSFELLLKVIRDILQIFTTMLSWAIFPIVGTILVQKMGLASSWMVWQTAAGVRCVLLFSYWKNASN